MARPRIKLMVIASFVREQKRATAREVAHGVQMTVADASRWLHHLQRSGEVTVVERVRVAHADRPVAVFGPSVRQQRSAIFSDDWLRN
jgi:CRP-like cAMP-binding protein